MNCVLCGQFPKMVKRNVCSICRNAQVRKRKNLSIDNVTYGPIRKGRESERLVSDFMRQHGFMTKLTTNKGSDVTALFDGEAVTFEVKTAFSISGRYYVNAVSKWRHGDDYVAIVLPNRRIHFEKMSDHLKKCNKDGRRHVTPILKEAA